jgi:hypothetical protein
MLCGVGGPARGRSPSEYRIGFSSCSACRRGPWGGTLSNRGREASEAGGIESFMFGGESSGWAQSIVTHPCQVVPGGVWSWGFESV